jgi:preprotein translocase subunit SecG
MLTVFINLLLVVHVAVSLLIILVVLMQRPKSEGLGAAFGGGMTENIFGAQTTSVLQNFTRWLGGIFFVLTLVLAMLYSHRSIAKSPVQQRLMSEPVPSASPAGATAKPAAATSPAAATAPAATATAAPAAPASSPAPSPQPAATASGEKDVPR